LSKGEGDLGRKQNWVGQTNKSGSRRVSEQFCKPFVVDKCGSRRSINIMTNNKNDDNVMHVNVCFKFLVNNVNVETHDL
jgi:hypothetical protein